MEGPFLLVLAGAVLGLVASAAWWALGTLFAFAVPGEAQVLALTILGAIAVPVGVGAVIISEDWK